MSREGFGECHVTDAHEARLGARSGESRAAFPELLVLPRLVRTSGLRHAPLSVFLFALSACLRSPAWPCPLPALLAQTPPPPGHPSLGPHPRERRHDGPVGRRGLPTPGSTAVVSGTSWIVRAWGVKDRPAKKGMEGGVPARSPVE